MSNRKSITSELLSTSVQGCKRITALPFPDHRGLQEFQRKHVAIDVRPLGLLAVVHLLLFTCNGLLAMETRNNCCIVMHGLVDESS